jgi:hypothetical protein
MALGPRDRNPLVCPIAGIPIGHESTDRPIRGGAIQGTDRADMADVTGERVLAGAPSLNGHSSLHFVERFQKVFFGLLKLMSGRICHRWLISLSQPASAITRWWTGCMP